MTVETTTPSDEQIMIRNRPALLFRLDDSLGLLGTNESDDPRNTTAPIVYLCFGAGLVVVRHHAGRPESWAEELERRITAAGRAETSADSIISRLAPSRNVMSGPVFRVPRLKTVPAGTVPLSGANCDLLHEYFRGMEDTVERHQPCIAWVINGAARQSGACGRIRDLRCACQPTV